MRRLALKLICLAVVGLTVASCGKYEEGPGFSLRTKKSRLAGVWEVEKYILPNGTEIEDNLNTEITYEKDGIMIARNDFERNGIIQTWEFHEKKAQIVTSYTIAGVVFADTFEILKLTDSEFWYKNSTNRQTYLKAK